jgi:hypothetical protein
MIYRAQPREPGCLMINSSDCDLFGFRRRAFAVFGTRVHKRKLLCASVTLVTLLRVQSTVVELLSSLAVHRDEHRDSSASFRELFVTLRRV